MFCPNCSQENGDLASHCINCGAPLPIQISSPIPTQPCAPAEEVPAPVQRKRRRPPLPVIITALILVVVMLLGLSTNWLGYYGPITKIALAAGRNLKAGSLTASVDIRLSNFTVKHLTIKAQIDTEQQELTVLATDKNSILQFAIYEGYYLERTGFGRYTAKDIEAQLDRFFQNTDKSSIDWENLIKTISPDLHQTLDDKINYNQLPDCMTKLYRKANRPSWLKNTAGFLRERLDGATIYTFQPDEDQFPQSCMECFQDAFLNQEEYDRMLEQVEQNGMPKMKLQCTVKSRRLSRIVLTAPVRGREISAEVVFSNIGKTSIDRSLLQEYLENAKPA